MYIDRPAHLPLPSPGFLFRVAAWSVRLEGVTVAGSPFIRNTCFDSKKRRIKCGGQAFRNMALTGKNGSDA